MNKLPKYLTRETYPHLFCYWRGQMVAKSETVSIPILLSTDIVWTFDGEGYPEASLDTVTVHYERNFCCWLQNEHLEEYHWYQVVPCNERYTRMREPKEEDNE